MNEAVTRTRAASVELVAAEHALADADRAYQSMGDWYEFGCGVGHESFEAEDACAECAAAEAAQCDLRRLDHVVAALRARQAALPWPSLRAAMSLSSGRRAQWDTVRPCEPLPDSPFLQRLFTRGRDFESEVVARLLELHPDALAVTERTPLSGAERERETF